MWRIELADRDVKAERKVVNAWAKKNKKELEGDKKMQAEYAVAQVLCALHVSG